MEGVTPQDNEIYLELEPDRLAKTLTALKSSSHPRSLKVKLTRKRDMPCLSFEIELGSSTLTGQTASTANGSMLTASRTCTHDVPVSLIPRRLWADYREPEMRAFDVSLYLPELKQLKTLTERYKNLGHFVSLQASRKGKLRLAMDTDQINVVTHFKNLEVPRFDDTAASVARLSNSRLQRSLNESFNRGEEEEEEKFALVRIELKRFNLFLGAEQVAPKKVIANFVTDKMVHMFLIHDDVCIQYFIPASLE